MTPRWLPLFETASLFFSDPPFTPPLRFEESIHGFLLSKRGTGESRGTETKAAEDRPMHWSSQPQFLVCRVKTTSGARS